MPLSLFRSALTLATVLSSVFATALLTAPSAHAQFPAQAIGYLSLDARLKVTPATGITITSTVGGAPIQSFQQQGTGQVSINYTNSVPGDGITTSVRLQPDTKFGPDVNQAQVSLLFTPTITLTNTTSTPLSYQYQYDLSFESFIRALPNGNSAFASESVSVVLSETNLGTLNTLSYSPIVSTTTSPAGSSYFPDPTSLNGTATIAARSSVTMSLRTSTAVNVLAQPLAAVAPEPGTVALLLTAGVPVVGIRRRQKRKKH